MKTYEVKKNEAGLTLLEFIQRMIPGSLSNKEIKRRIEDNFCEVNGAFARIASKKMAFKDSVKWDDKERILEKIVFDPARILFEDQDLLIYNKPAGVASDAQGILSHLKPHGRFILVHRLDKFTSGILLLAKNEKAAASLLNAFKEREVEKRYIAFVDRVPKTKSGVIANKLGKISSLQGQTIYGSVQSGKDAKTRWSLQKAYKNASILSCYPETGRTHQIRVHLSEMGHPILGDFQYGKTFTCKIKPKRMLLHAYEIAFPHPGTHQKITIKSPLPKDFQDMVKSVS